MTVLLFASYADAFGKSHLEIALPDGATVADAVDRVKAMRGVNELPPRPLVAVNECYASAGQRLLQGDQVALIPPVAGG